MSKRDCLFCGSKKTVPDSTPDAFAYCSGCSEERRQLARKHFGPCELVTSEDGRYVWARKIEAATDEEADALADVLMERYKDAWQAIADGDDDEQL